MVQYANAHRQENEFAKGDWVYLKIAALPTTFCPTPQFSKSSLVAISGPSESSTASDLRHTNWNCRRLRESIQYFVCPCFALVWVLRRTSFVPFHRVSTVRNHPPLRTECLISEATKRRRKLW
ncbi:hypothetical protein Salat_2134300 [Sesamum alatum]|uniref:Uncharacterized protein n=1 Tax=Sesamum alatum TaxID=300844 RepID=A0AAE1Y1L5_9LAMI|nr:hypothetical protein Salat_2134300 [Sesamum alatum]